MNGLIHLNREGYKLLAVAYKDWVLGKSRQPPQWSQNSNPRRPTPQVPQDDREKRGHRSYGPNRPPLSGFRHPPPSNRGRPPPPDANHPPQHWGTHREVGNYGGGGHQDKSNIIQALASLIGMMPKM